MDPNLLARAKPIFDAAVGESSHERERILSESCGGDADLRALVETLLADHDRAPDSFIKPPRDETVSADEEPEPGPLPSRIGHYEIIRRIESGGMGSVYEARQDSPRRTVALKVMRADAIGRGAVKRFHREIDTLGKLSHPGIAHIYEAGEFATAASVQPYFAMELVPGERLLEYATHASLAVSEQLELMAKVCDAVHYAHEQGVIHRDLKPENILVVDLPGARAQPKILDFGIAKAVGSDRPPTTQTRSGEIIGTLPYMSPEQITGRSENLDARSDVYQLGAILYRLLAGRPVHELGHVPLPEAARIIQSRQPTRLGDVDTRYHGSIETVVGRALERDRRRRHSSALDLGLDLRRCADQERAIAGRSWRVRLQRAMRRMGRWRPRPATVTIVVAVVLAAAAAVPEVRHSFLKWIGLRSLPAARNLAVLPFSSASGDADDEAIARGMSEVVTWRLSLLTRAPPFTVAAASFVQARGEPGAREVGAELGANLAIIGRLARAGSEATVELSLVQDVSGEVLRRGSVTAAFDDPMALEYETVLTVLELAGVEVPPPRRRVLTEYGTDHAAAYHLYLEGLGFLQQGRPEDLASATSAFEGAITLDARFGRARVGLARGLWRLGSAGSNVALRERALAECAEVVRLDGDDASAHLFLGAWSRELGRLDEARLHLERASYLEPTNDDILYSLRKVYLDLDLDEQIERLCRSAIELRPHSWQGYRWLGRHYYWESRLADAIPLLERVVELAPRNYRALNVLGAACAQSGRFDRAAEAFEAAVRIKPTGLAHANLATAYFDQGFYRKAVEAYESAIIFMRREKSLSFGIFGNLGHALYWAPGEREKAAAQYRKAIGMAAADLERSPDDAAVVGRVAVYHARLGEREVALDRISKAVALAPTDAHTCFHAALVHQQLDEPAEALVWLEKALEAGTPAISVANHPAFRSLREDERFRSALESYDVPI